MRNTGGCSGGTTMSTETESKYKHLTLDNRLELQDHLLHGMSFKDSAKRLGKDPTTIAKEVQKHIQIIKPAGVPAGTREFDSKK